MGVKEIGCLSHSEISEYSFHYSCSIELFTMYVWTIRILDIKKKLTATFFYWYKFKVNTNEFFENIKMKYCLDLANVYQHSEKITQI